MKGFSKVLTLAAGLGIATTLPKTKQNFRCLDVLVKDAIAQTIIVPGSYTKLDISTPEKAFEAMNLALQTDNKKLFGQLMPVDYDGGGWDGAREDGINRYFEEMKKMDIRLTDVKTYKAIPDLACLEILTSIEGEQIRDLIFAIKEKGGWKCIVDCEYGYFDPVREFFVRIYLQGIAGYLEEYKIRHGTYP